jgi:hypothetical protein
MRHRWALLAGGFTCVLLGRGPAAAYPIPPRTLWELTAEAELVVLATVMRKEERKPASDRDWDSEVAVLQVKEVWKGRAGAEVRVPFPAGLLCPAPPRFEPLLDVVAFLVRDKDKAFEVPALSYGTLYPEHRDIPAFRRLVKEAVTVQARTDKATAARDRTDWLVAAAEEPATRWHGLYELDSSADGMHAFYDSRQRTEVMALTEQQVERLTTAFVEQPRLDATFPMLLRLLRDRPSAEVDRTAVAAIDTWMDSKMPPHWIGAVIELTRARLGQPSPPKVIKKPKKEITLDDDPILFQAADPTGLRKEWAALRKKL